MYACIDVRPPNADQRNFVLMPTGRGGVSSFLSSATFGKCAFLSQHLLPVTRNPGGTFSVSLKVCGTTGNCDIVPFRVNTGTYDSHLPTRVFQQLGILVDLTAVRVESGPHGDVAVVPYGDVLVEINEQKIRLLMASSGENGVAILGLRDLEHLGATLVLSGSMQGLHFSSAQFSSQPVSVTNPITIDDWVLLSPQLYPGKQTAFAIQTRAVPYTDLLMAIQKECATDDESDYSMCALTSKLLHCAPDDELCVRSVEFEFSTVTHARRQLLNSGDAAFVNGYIPPAAQSRLSDVRDQLTIIVDFRTSLLESSRVKCTYAKAARWCDRWRTYVRCVERQDEDACNRFDADVETSMFDVAFYTRDLDVTFEDPFEEVFGK
eukprot:TRINITY_DN8455_c0_g1_i1.p1 TRINITY_DN8455_c0_g1~~TRINITY_DN8455_c0_g1_i1.p1  ORF type:complete len:378 (-),score=61.61 TRINITY_DN8455_c0_g1_i1:28-1161(-)